MKNQYFGDVNDYRKYGLQHVDFIFFDPDDGLASNDTPKKAKKPGHKNSSKKLFRDEVKTTLRMRFSVLLYQHFDHLNERQEFVSRLGGELAGMTKAEMSYSFWTPHLVFFLVPTREHAERISKAVDRVRRSDWAKEGSCPTCDTNGRRQIRVDGHTVNREVQA
jgi:hypothetical protein